MISIMINTYNRSEILIEALQKLRPIWKKAEMVVVDDCSTDTTEKDVAEFVRKNEANVKYVRNGRNLGYAKSLNIGIKSCSNDFVFILNDDNVLFEPEKSLATLEKYQDKNIIVGTRLVMEAGFSLLRRLYAFIYRMPAEILAGEVYNYNGEKKRTVRYCNNAFGFNRKIGIIFDERSFVKNVFRIESDFQKRARSKGIKISYDPAIRILDRWVQHGGLREKRENLLLYCILNHTVFLRKNFSISKYWKIPFYFLLKTVTHPYLILKIMRTTNQSFKKSVYTG